MKFNIKKRTWDELIFRLKEKYPQLADSDFQYEEGMEENMLQQLENMLGKTKEEMQEIIESLSIYFSLVE